MTQSPDMQPLAEALATFHATRSAYQSTSDQALAQLLTSLAAEVLALRSLPQTDVGPAADVSALQAQLAALQAAYDAQQGELAQLRALVGQPQPPARRRREIIVSPPRVVRPMDYWEQHVPDYGDATTATDLAATRSKRRVRPEDVMLTGEERARLERRRPSASVPLWLFWLLIVILAVSFFVIVYYVGR